MTNIFRLSTLAIIFSFSINASLGQATRTWVSGVGDDANPCSRTAPCKTFAGAISKTAANGEINVLDGGGYGGVTITKSITISSDGTTAGALVAGTSGIIINAAATDRVILRGIDINGLYTTGNSTHGVNIMQAGSVLIENCVINGFSNAASGNGINVSPGTNPVKVIAQNCRISNCNKAVNVVPTGVVIAEINVIGVLIGMNDVGVNSTGTGATVRLFNSSIVNNNTGVSASTGKVISFGNNIIAGNTTNNPVTVMSQL